MQPEGTPLLWTKLDLPPPPAHTLARERLLAAIASMPGARLVLACAPAGFGKTTLLTTWCRALLQDGTAVAWLSLDERDNNPIASWPTWSPRLSVRPGSSCRPCAIGRAPAAKPS